MLEIFGKEISTRQLSCSMNGFESEKILPYINFYVQVTNHCQANCPFCIYHNNESEEGKFDFVKYKEILQELSKYPVKKFNFTGGEPLLFSWLFSEIVECTNDYFKKSNNITEITLNTNGNSNWIFDVVPYSKYFDYIALSRHHYLDDKNYEIFETKSIISADNIVKFNKDIDCKLQLRCNLISGYIDSNESIREYMNFWMDRDITDFGFVTLAPNNEYCKTHQVQFNDLIKEDDDLITNFTHKRIEDGEVYCACSNYVYKHNGTFATLYSRHFNHNTNTDNMLVYDGQYLRNGFNGDIIY